MKLSIKILVFFIVALAFLLVIPIMSVRLAEGYEIFGLSVMHFFIVMPLLSIGSGILAGTDARRLWWMPLTVALLFPPAFSLAIGEMVWELYVYSAIYIVLGFFALLPTALTLFAINKRRNYYENDRKK